MPNKTASTDNAPLSLPKWIDVEKRLPEPYTDVQIKMEDGLKRIGRIGVMRVEGAWQLASYQKCKYQYFSTKVVEWLDLGDFK